MCLGQLGRLVEADGAAGVLDIGGRRVAVNLAFTPGAAVGEWVLAHSGMAVRVVPAEGAATARSLAAEAQGRAAPGG